MLSSHFVLLTLTEAINHSFICTLILHKNSPWAQIRKEKKAWTYQYEDKKTVKAMGGQILIMSSLWFGIIKSCSTASACKTHAGQPTKKKKRKNHWIIFWKGEVLLPWRRCVYLRHPKAWLMASIDSSNLHARLQKSHHNTLDSGTAYTLYMIKTLKDIFSSNQLH